MYLEMIKLHLGENMVHIVIKGNGIYEIKHINPLPQSEEGKEESVGDKKEEIKEWVEWGMLTLFSEKLEK